MPDIDIGALRAVADRLDPLELKYAFTGGAVVNLLLDNPELNPVRPTKDVDVIVELLSFEGYAKIEDILRGAGFENDLEGPICRWRLGTLVVDIMPSRGEQYGLHTKWFPEVF
jgi:hypothetical protein